MVEAMRYVPAWERLPEALSRVVSATRCSQEEAQADICRAIADGAVRVRGKLERHATRGTTSSNTIIEGKEFQIPTGLNPADLDWQGSRPLKPWVVRREAHRVPGDWNLEWIELCRIEVTNVLCPVEQHGFAQRASPKMGGTRKSRPAFERAKHAVGKLYPQGVPDQATEPNKSLCWRVSETLQELGLPSVSDDTILRAAGRRK